MLRDFLIALSLANLCFIRVWPDALNSASANIYYLKRPLSPFDEAPLILTIVLLALIMWGSVRLARRARTPCALNVLRWIFLLALTIPLNGIRTQFPFLSLTASFAHLGQAGTVLLLFTLAVAVTGALVKWYRHLVHASVTIVLIMSPFVLFTFTALLWPLINHSLTDMADRSLAPAVAGVEPKPPRIVWMIFDEMDQYVAFEGRPSSLNLPEFDRFRAQSISATRVRSPANMTEESLPALITGKQVAEAEPAGPAELMLTFKDTRNPVQWSRVPNVFSRAREAGINTGVVGWYLPYCRIIASSLTTCYWHILESKYGVRAGTTWFDEMVWLPTLIQTLPVPGEFALRERLESLLGTKLPEGRNYAKVTVAAYRRMLNEAIKVTTDPHIGLVLVHWPIPHPPAIYDRHIGDFAYHGLGNYLDNLALVDRTLSRMRKELEAADLWDSSLILLTADHGYRDQAWKQSWVADEPNIDIAQIDRHVPFLLKLPYQKEGLTYDRPFNSVLIPDLFMAFIHGKISDSKSVTAWLDQHNTQDDSLMVKNCSPSSAC